MNQNPIQNQAGHPHVHETIACLGTGYTAGVTMITLAFQCDVVVVMLDVNNENIDEWLADIIPFNEPDMDHMFDDARNNGRLIFGQNHNIQAALTAADCIIMAIDNPINKIDNTLNLTKWEDSWRRVARHAPGKLVIEKSNLPFDGEENIIQIFRQQGVLHDPIVVYNPEFYSLGTAATDLLNPSQVIFGGNPQIVMGPNFNAYRNLLYWVDNGVVFRYQDYKSVILAKMGINVLLASKISILNSIASISAAVKADMSSIMDIMGRDQRLGPTYLTPGIGFGGPNLVRDTQLLGKVALNNGLLEEKQFYARVLKNNEAVGKRFVNMVVHKMIGVKNKTIAIFGLASKHDISDLTNSPAVEVCKLLLNHGVHLRIYDQFIPDHDNILRNFTGRGQRQRVVVATNPVDTATNASAICVLNNCNAYQVGGIQFYNGLFAVMRHPSYIFDGSQNLDINWQDVANIGFSIHAVGRPSIGLGFE